VKVFVAGGTGAIGGHAVPALVAAGHTVTAVARSPEKAAKVSEQGAKPVHVSIFDRVALTEAMAGHAAVVNLASAIPPMTKFMRTSAWRDNDRVRTEGSAAMVDAAIDAGVGRVVQESVSMLYPDRGAQWIDESVPTDRYPMAQANLAAEANAERFSEAGGTGIVLRFGWFYGPGATHSEQLLALARRHICVQMGRADGYVSSIHMVDGGTAVAAALGAPGGTFNIVDDQPLTKRSYAEALAEAARTSTWLRAPGRAALLLGDRSTSLTRSLRVSNERFRAATGWSPRYASRARAELSAAAVKRRELRSRAHPRNRTCTGPTCGTMTHPALLRDPGHSNRADSSSERERGATVSLRGHSFLSERPSTAPSRSTETGPSSLTAITVASGSSWL
jgi:nucleoside-diphosphate-sugar epimerase